MVRTTLLLPEDLKSAAQAIARKRGISFGKLVRSALEQLTRGTKAVNARERDPLFSGFRPFEGKAPRNLSESHDHYLYDDR